MICSKQHAVSLCGSHLVFSKNFFLESKWCNHTVVLTWLQFGKIPALFHQRSIFHMIDNLSRAVHVFCMHMLTLLSVDEVCETV